jgi:hypothetical protein
VIVKDNFAREILPEIKLLDYETSVKAALEKLQAGEVETVWSDALVTTQGTVKTRCTDHC